MPLLFSDETVEKYDQQRVLDEVFEYYSDLNKRCVDRIPLPFSKDIELPDWIDYGQGTMCALFLFIKPEERFNAVALVNSKPAFSSLREVLREDVNHLPQHFFSLLILLHDHILRPELVKVIKDGNEQAVTYVRDVLLRPYPEGWYGHFIIDKIRNTDFTYTE